MHFASDRAEQNSTLPNNRAADLPKASNLVPQRQNVPQASWLPAINRLRTTLQHVRKLKHYQTQINFSLQSFKNTQDNPSIKTHPKKLLQVLQKRSHQTSVLLVLSRLGQSQ
jgi:hypothetical protein